MPDRAPVLLTPVRTPLGGAVFAEIAGWPFADAFVARLLRTDIPRRVRFNACQLWTYLDPDGVTVGFGTLDVCEEYDRLTGGLPHPYPPLLATNPTVKSKGFGSSIVRHLLGEAAVLAHTSGSHNELFLDVYTSSTKAIEVYTNAGFAPVGPPLPDPDDGGKPYLVMARRVSVALVPTPPPPA